MNVHTHLSDADVPSAINALRLLRKPECTALARALETAERLRGSQPAITGRFAPLEPIEEYEHAQEQRPRYTREQSRQGGHRRAVSKNKEALFEKAKAVIPLFIRNNWENSLPLVLGAVQRFGIPKEWLDAEVRKGTLAKSTEERICALLNEKAIAENELEKEFDRLDAHNASYIERENELAPLRARVEHLSTELNRLGG